jgi:hypothetical protein
VIEGEFVIGGLLVDDPKLSFSTMRGILLKVFVQVISLRHSEKVRHIKSVWAYMQKLVIRYREALRDKKLTKFAADIDLFLLESALFWTTRGCIGASLSSAVRVGDQVTVVLGFSQ